VVNPGCDCLRQRKKGKRSRCRARASYRIGVQLKERDGGESVTIFVKLMCCSSCRRRLVLPDIVTRRTFEQMASFVYANHRFSPRFNRTQLSFAPLKS